MVLWEGPSLTPGLLPSYWTPLTSGGQGHITQRDQVSTAVTIPIAIKCLELDLIEGSWLCGKQEIVRGTGLSGQETQCLGQDPTEKGIQAGHKKVQSLTQICVEEGADTASQSRGPSKWAADNLR